jgi:hypothetical protein
MPFFTGKSNTQPPVSPPCKSLLPLATVAISATEIRLRLMPWTGLNPPPPSILLKSCGRPGKSLSLSPPLPRNKPRYAESASPRGLLTGATKRIDFDSFESTPFSQCGVILRPPACSSRGYGEEARRAIEATALESCKQAVALQCRSLKSSRTRMRVGTPPPELPAPPPQPPSLFSTRRFTPPILVTPRCALTPAVI